MASAYELMLVLRGRNYLSNDLRKASADIRGLSRANALSGLQNQRAQLAINAQRLATTKKIAQNELSSLQTGSRSIALQQRANVLAEKRAAATVKLAAAQRDLTMAQDAQVANAAKLSGVGAQLGKRQDIGSGGYARLREQHAALLKIDQELIAEQVKLAASVEEAELAMAKLDIEEQKLIARTSEFAQRQAVLTDRINTTTAAINLNAAKMAENELAQRKASSSLGQYGLVAEHVGRTLQTFGLIAGAAVAVAANAASKFSTGGVLAATQLITAGQSSPVNIRKTGDLVNSEILKFLASGKSVSSAAEVQQAAYNIPSGIPSLRGDSNQKAKETIALIKEFNQVAKANYGLVELNGVTEAGIILINTFGTSIGRLPREFDVMQSAVNRGKLTLGEFVKGLSQTAPAAKAAGYDFDSMSSVLSFLSGKLPQYTRVAVGYARALELFQNKKFEDYMKAKGAAITDLTGKLLPYNQIIQQILKVDPSLAKAGNLISFLKTASGASGFMQARRVLTVSLQDQAGLNRAVSAVPQNARGLVNASATALSQTGAVKWKELTTQVKALAIAIGQGAIPAFQDFAKPLERALNWFNQLSPSTRKLVGEITAFAAVGMILSGTLLMIAGGLARAFLALKMLRGTRTTGLLGAEAGFTTAGLAMRAGLIGALLIGIPLLIKYHNSLGSIVDIVSAVGVAFGAFTVAKFLSKIAAAQLGVLALRTELMLLTAAPWIIMIEVIGLELVAKKIKALQEKYLSAESRQLAPKDLTKEVNAFIPKAVSLKAKGETGAQILKYFQNLLGTSDLANQVITAIFDRLNAPLKGKAGIAGRRNYNPADVVKLTNSASGAPPPFTDANVLAAVKNIVKLDELAKRKPTIANFEKASAALKALQSKANADQFAAAQQLISAMESVETKHNRKSVSDAKKAAAARVQALKDAAANVGSIYDSLLSQNESVMGQLFGGPYSQSPAVQNRLQYGGKLTGGDYLKDLQSQTNQFKTFYSQIGRLQKKGAPQELINQLIQAGPAALPAIKALSAMGSKQWSEYIKTFNTGQKLLHKQTMIQLTDQLKDYRKYGNKIALQIISGMRDHRIGLAKELKALITNMFGVDTPLVSGASKTALSDAKKVAKTHATTKAADAYSGATTHTRPVTGTHTRTTQGVVEQHTHYHLTAPTSEHASIKTQIRHADFARKTKIGMNP